MYVDRFSTLISSLYVSSVDEARRAAEEASWFKDTYKYWRIVYRYYESASLLLEETQVSSCQQPRSRNGVYIVAHLRCQRVTDGAARANGPEGCTNRNQRGFSILAMELTC